MQLEGGTYEILRNRLQKSGAELRTRLDQLNQERKSVFGAIETKLITTERITTENNCVPWDMVPVGSTLLFGYNVYLGLKSEVELSDVFGVYTYEGHSFHQQPLDLLQDKGVSGGLSEALQLLQEHPVRQVRRPRQRTCSWCFGSARGVNDIKTFKWADRRATRSPISTTAATTSTRFPPQHEFELEAHDARHAPPRRASARLASRTASSSRPSAAT